MGHDMSIPTPPRLAGRILGLMISLHDRDAVLGDLDEEFAIRLRLGSRGSAQTWYWKQTLRSLPPVLRSRARREGWARTFAIALGIYFLVGPIEFLLGAGLALVISPSDPQADVVEMLVGLLTLALAGYLANSVRDRAAQVLSGIVVAAVGVLMLVVPGSVPVWYQLAFLIGGPVATWRGGSLAKRKETG